MIVKPTGIQSKNQKLKHIYLEENKIFTCTYDPPKSKVKTNQSKFKKTVLHPEKIWGQLFQFGVLSAFLNTSKIL